MRRSFAVLVLVACGDNSPPPPDAPGPPVAPPCVASFTGNFTETAQLAPDCAMLPASGTLAFTLPSATLATNDAIAIDLGTPAVGSYTSASVQQWSAQATVVHGTAECVYLAGSSAVPNGRFMLTLTALDPSHSSAHGTLVVVQNVLAGAETNCGAGDLETVTVTF